MTSAEVESQRRRFGANVLTPPARDPWWVQFLEKFNDPVIRILMIAAVIAVAVGVFNNAFGEGEAEAGEGILEGVGILVAILLATGLAFLNEFKANREFDVLNQVSDEVPIKVIRDGNYQTVPLRDLVVGDVAFVETGDEVPADGELIEAVSLRVVESALTGETEASSKRPAASETARLTSEPSAEGSTIPTHRLMRGTSVVDGYGHLRVTEVGDATEIGRTARAGIEETGDRSPLDRQLDRLSKIIGVVGLSVAVLTFVALMVRGSVTGRLPLTAAQGVVVAWVGAGLVIALVPVWLPMLSDAWVLLRSLRRTRSRSERSQETPARPRTEWFRSLGGWLAMMGTGIAAVAAGLALSWGAGWIDSDPTRWISPATASELLRYFMIAVTIIVVAVPEGLAMSVTLSLAYSMRKMTAAHTLVRKMDACETIGATTVICSDKTGTLTQNAMRVHRAFFPLLGGGGAETPETTHPTGETGPDGSDVERRIAEAMAVNSTAHLRDHEGQRQALGNPTEGALLLWLADRGFDYAALRSDFGLEQQITFSTERKYMATIGRSALGGRRLYVKGAPEIVLARCQTVATPGGTDTLDHHRDAIESQLHDFQRRGMRTLGLAERTITNSSSQHPAPGTATTDQGGIADETVTDLVWLGFVAIADPIREDVPAAIEACRRAGIDVKIVTGDTQHTAQEIARQIGLVGSQSGANVHVAGAAFREMSDAEAITASARLQVLSRATPTDKVRLVRSLQSQGHVVAVTGDGINDCGALNYADVGLAMGQAGKAAAKEASDIILLNDSFATIVEAVRWGRSLYQNIQRFLLFQLTINVVALGVAMLGPFIGVELPLTVIQMLWVNLIMDTFAALALATEPPHAGVLDRPPRRPEAFIITPGMASIILATGAAFLVLLISLLLYFQQPDAVSKPPGAVTDPAAVPLTSPKPASPTPSATVGLDEGTGAEASEHDGSVSAFVTRRELSLFFSIFVMLQFWNLFNVRVLGQSRSAFSGLINNPTFLIVAAGILGGTILLVQFGGSFFRTEPLSVTDWLIVIGATSAVLWIGEIARAIGRLRPQRAARSASRLSEAS